VRNGDIFEFGIENGICVIKKHESKIQNLDNEIIAAYAVINYQVGEQVITNAEIMTIKQIKQSWLQSYSYKDGGIHSKFDEEMAKKTVINRACKVLINSSSDVVTDIDIDEEVATETVEESKAIDIMAFEDVPELESHECINEQQVEPTQKKDSEPKMKVQQKDIFENEKLPF
jgi:recombination protein RecT